MYNNLLHTMLIDEAIRKGEWHSPPIQQIWAFGKRPYTSLQYGQDAGKLDKKLLSQVTRQKTCYLTSQQSPQMSSAFRQLSFYSGADIKDECEFIRGIKAYNDQKSHYH